MMTKPMPDPIIKPASELSADEYAARAGVDRTKVSGEAGNYAIAPELPVPGDKFQSGGQTFSAVPGGSGIVSSSTQYRDGIDTLGDSITTLSQDFGMEKPNEDFDKTLGDMTKDIIDQRDLIKNRATEDVTNINKGVDIAKEQLSMDQKEALDIAEGRTRIGGFLTEIEVKDILKMRRQNSLDLAALETKRQELITSARRAYEDEDYKLARDLVSEAKDLRTRMSNEKKDFMNAVLNISQEKRTATKFVRDEAQGKIDSIIKGIETGSIDPNTLSQSAKDRLMKDAGYDFDIFAATKKLAEQGKVLNTYTDSKAGKVYATIQKPDGTFEQKEIGTVIPSTGGTETENARELARLKASAMAEAQGLFTKSESEGGFKGADGKIDPDNYRVTMQEFASSYGVTPLEFMKQFPPERFLSPGELKANPDLTSVTPKAGDTLVGGVPTE